MSLGCRRIRFWLLVCGGFYDNYIESILKNSPCVFLSVCIYNSSVILCFKTMHSCFMNSAESFLDVYLSYHILRRQEVRDASF